MTKQLLFKHWIWQGREGTRIVVPAVATRLSLDCCVKWAFKPFFIIYYFHCSLRFPMWSAQQHLHYVTWFEEITHRQSKEIRNSSENFFFNYYFQCWQLGWNCFLHGDHWIMFPWPHTERCRYNAVNFLQNPHNRQSIAHPWGRDMGVSFLF